MKAGQMAMLRALVATLDELNERALELDGQKGQRSVLRQIKAVYAELARVEAGYL